MPAPKPLSLPLAAILIGQPKALESQHTAKPWVSAIHKLPVSNPIWLDKLNLAGDAQAHPAVHGGLEQALCVYPGSHYRHWAGRLGQPLLPGSFGENLTLSGEATEHDVCIGDIFHLGEAIVQISQPRSPCYQLGLRWHQKMLPKWLQDSGFTGWYMRVLQPGLVAPTDTLTLIHRPHPEWTVAQANSVKYELRENLKLVAALAQCPALGQQWQQKMLGRLSGVLPLYDDEHRLEGAK